VNPFKAIKNKLAPAKDNSQTLPDRAGAACHLTGITKKVKVQGFYVDTDNAWLHKSYSTTVRMDFDKRNGKDICGIPVENISSVTLTPEGHNSINLSVRHGVKQQKDDYIPADWLESEAVRVNLQDSLISKDQDKEVISMWAAQQGLVGVFDSFTLQQMASYISLADRETYDSLPDHARPYENTESGVWLDKDAEAVGTQEGAAQRYVIPMLTIQKKYQYMFSMLTPGSPVNIQSMEGRGGKPIECIYAGCKDELPVLIVSPAGEDVIMSDRGSIVDALDVYAKELIAIAPSRVQVPTFSSNRINGELIAEPLRRMISSYITDLHDVTLDQRMKKAAGIINLAHFMHDTAGIDISEILTDVYDINRFSAIPQENGIAQDIESSRPDVADVLRAIDELAEAFAADYEPDPLHPDEYTDKMRKNIEELRANIRNDIIDIETGTHDNTPEAYESIPLEIKAIRLPKESDLAEIMNSPSWATISPNMPEFWCEDVNGYKYIFKPNNYFQETRSSLHPVIEVEQGDVPFVLGEKITINSNNYFAINESGLLISQKSISSDIYKEEIFGELKSWTEKEFPNLTRDRLHLTPEDVAYSLNDNRAYAGDEER